MREADAGGGVTVRPHHRHPREHSEVLAGRAWKAHAIDVVRDAGLRAGGGRAAVIDVLADERCVVSAQEIVDRLQRRGSRGANLATVYRALEVLHELQLLQRLDAGDGTARYERAAPDGDHHHHVLYPDGTIEPFHDDELEQVVHALADRLGITITGHDIVLHAAPRADSAG